MKNLVILIGNLGADPEIRTANSGVTVASFTVATSERWKDKDGNKQEQTEWHKVVAWKRLGELCGEYLSKGSKVYIEGKLQTRKWKDKSGNDRYTTEIIARDIQFLTPKSENRSDYGESSGPPVTDDFAGAGGDVPF